MSEPAKSALIYRGYPAHKALNFEVVEVNDGLRNNRHRPTSAQ